MTPARGTLADRASLVLTIIFFAALETLTIVWSFYWLLLSALVLLLISGTILTQREDIRIRGPHVLILPLLYVGGVFLFLLFVSQGIFQQLFILLATTGYFFLVARGIEWAFPTWNWFFTSITFFLLLSGIYGLHFHIRFPLWAVVLLGSGTTFLLSLHTLGRAPVTKLKRIFWSILLAFLMSELLGVFALLPLSYLVVSGSLFVMFYVALHLLQKHLYEHLTPRIVAEYLILATIAISIMLATAHWAVI